jgi:DNA invertase Pin-like site-specific DNA recombinase
LGRSLADLVRIIGRLDAVGVGFESITERIETSSAAGRLIFHVFAALAEFERNLIRERTRAGLAAARARGRKGGRRPSLSPQQIREIRALLRDPDIRVVDVAARYGVSRTTLYRHVDANSLQPSKLTKKWSDNAKKTELDGIKWVSATEQETRHADS